MNAFPTSVRIVEVGPRDGLQNEANPISAELKIALIERLVDAGVRHLEAGAFVSPKRVPQMADSLDVMLGMTRRPGAIYAALVPNMKGFELALAAGADEAVIFGAASESFSERNIGCSIAESISRFAPVAEAARAAGMRLRASVSCALGCPFEGEVAPSAVADLVARLADLGCDEIDIADTIGVGTPDGVRRAFEAAASRFPLARLAAHFHDTYGQALANTLAALDIGVAIHHASVAGLGGCPFAPGATGNVATEDVLYLMHGLGIETGIDLEQVVAIGGWISEAIARPNASRAGRAMLARQRRAAAAA